MDTERIILDVDERQAVAGAQKANQALENVERTGKRAGAAVERAVNQQAEAIVRITDRSRQSIDRLVANAERKASFAGKTGVDRLAAERDLLIGSSAARSAPSSA